MTIEVRVPQLPESVADATLVAWRKQPGDAVARDESLVDLETDKVVLEVPAPAAGVIKELKFKDGSTVTSGQVLALIEESPRAVAGAAATGTFAVPPAPAAASTAQPLGGGSPPATVAPAGAAKLSPAAKRVVEENQVDPKAVVGSGRDGRVSKSDVVNYLEKREVPVSAPAGAGAAGTVGAATAAATPASALSRAGGAPGAASAAPAGPAARAAGGSGSGGGARGARLEQRVPMTRLRARIAERMVQAQTTQALLTSFNEVDLGAVNALRSRYREAFEKQHGVRLGYMSFFAKACIEALRKFPAVNASVEGTEIIYHEYFDLGIAVSTDRGLIVPILRDADQMSFAEIEKAIGTYAERARTGSITLEELTGGTFTITNGGVFGSLLSTPIVNAPQSAILGMHKIQDRPVVIDGQVVVRPMMYIALTYDHRIIDGREAVQFLVTVKQCLEDPARMVLAI
ncbi:MAG TPA: 2-oxoglutarate dehydrogenase complex dihydrolipoyllysine-residue succinyltransferase [Steroidobacteraceae bacterium]|nr:2-oxoglutarate dehydrogenase complex dihydrolipoyllysine-residue succinyltransferase [Steroidobacteraceae bacterium]